MKKGRLAPYILVSFLIHAGFLIGAHRFLKLPAEELETAEFIPVEVVVVREDSPASEPELVPGERIWPKKALQAKSQIMMETATDRSADDMATPKPKAGGFEPNVTIAGMATTGYIAEAQAGESADSKPIVPARQILPSQISPVEPSAPIETALLEVEMPPLTTTSNNEPRMKVVRVPTRGFIPGARKGESVVGKPMIPASPIFPTQVSPVYPSTPAEFSQLEVKIPVVLVEAKATLPPADSATPHKVATPFSGSRSAVEPVFEMQPRAAKDIDQPHVSVDMAPTQGFTPVARFGESIAGKPMLPASLISPWQLSPADPSPPSTSSPLDVRMPAAPIEAKAATTPAYSHSLRKIETPLSGRRRREDLAAEHQPIPREGTTEPVLMVSTLQVQSRPNGAQFYVNGELIGETPLILELPLGKHEVRLALPNYYEWDAQVELTPEHKTLPITYRLVPIEETK